MCGECVPEKNYEAFFLNGIQLSVVSPKHFYTAPTSDKNMGLFANVSLDPGDIWWGNSYTDCRFVERIIHWDDHVIRSSDDRHRDEVLCFFDSEFRSLVICTEPFCRVNHGRRGSEANSDCDSYGNSIAITHIPKGREILIPYDYEAVISLMWKFPQFNSTVPACQRANDAFLFASARDEQLAVDFLLNLSGTDSIR